MNRGEPLAAANEIEQRRSSRIRCGGVVRVVEETSCGAREERRVVLLQIRRVEIRGVVGDRRAPRAGLRAERLDRFRGEWNGRVDISGGAAKHEHLSWLLRLRGRLTRK